MRAAALLLVAAASVATAAPVDRPRTYLLSIVGLPIGRDGAVDRFRFRTWGVEVRAVCRIPRGWRITAGGSLTPEGAIAGEGSLGVTWLRTASPPALRRLILVTLVAPVRRADRREADGVVPATFAGEAFVLGPDDQTARARPIGWRNIRLEPARRCPD